MYIYIYNIYIYTYIYIKVIMQKHTIEEYLSLKVNDLIAQKAV